MRKLLLALSLILPSAALAQAPRVSSGGTTITIGTANGLTLSAGALSLTAADGTHAGAVTTGTQTIAGAKTFSGAISASNLSGTNTGDITLSNVGSSSNSAGMSLSGQALQLQPANASFGGAVSTTTQTFAGVKTFSSIPIAAGLTAPASTGMVYTSNLASGGTAAHIFDTTVDFGANSIFQWKNNGSEKAFLDGNGNLTLYGGYLGGTLQTTGEFRKYQGDSSLTIRGHKDAASTDTADVVTTTTNLRSAGNIVDFQNNDVSKATVRYDGRISAPDFACNAADCTIAATPGSATGVSSGLFPHIFFLKMTVPYTAYIENASAAHVALFTLPARARILRAYADSTTPYTVAAGTIKLSVGAASDGDTTILLQKDIKTAAMFQGGSKAASNTSDLGPTMLNGGFMWINTSNQPATQVINAVIATGTGNAGNGTVTNLTAGSTSFSFVIEILP